MTSVLLAAAVLLAAGDPVAWADDLVAGLESGRREAGVAPLVRDPGLDEVARRRAERMASLPDGRHFALDVPLDRELDDAGLVDYKRAAEHLATLGGYDDVGAAAVAQWREYTVGWKQAMEASWSRVGAAVLRGADGTMFVAAVLVETSKRLPTREALERAVFETVNERRREENLSPLVWSERLADVARAHSADMVRTGSFDHESPSGSTPATRLAAAGIRYDAMAENIAKNRRVDDPAVTAVYGWMSSRPHRAAILDHEFVETGVGVAVARDGTVFFTQLFLKPTKPSP